VYRYSYEDISGKEKCKLSLQRELGFRPNATTPLIGYIGRLDSQKGPDLVLKAIPWIVANRDQVVMLGTGNSAIQHEMKEVEDRFR